MEALRNDKSDNKIPLELLPIRALEEVAKTLAYGSEKYEEHNWRKGLGWSRCMGSCLRHIFLWMKGQDIDQESGLHHIAHAACNLLFIMEWVITDTGTDDRFKY